MQCHIMLKLCLCFVHLQGIYVMWIKILHLANHGVALTSISIYWESIICHVPLQWVRQERISGTAFYLLVIALWILSLEVWCPCSGLIMQAEVQIGRLLSHIRTGIALGTVLSCRNYKGSNMKENTSSAMNEVYGSFCFGF